MKLTKYFSQFLRDSVNLNQTRLGQLDDRVDKITAALKEAPNLDGVVVVETVPQGSWAHRTIIRPAAGHEFDADFLVSLDENSDWNADPRKYANVVWKALQGHSTYGSMTTRKNRCVRVTYANDCHIDVIPYVVLSSGREVIVNRTTGEFEDTNPIGFTDWIQEKDDHTKGDLRKVLRLLKYLRDHQGAFDIKSVLLTTLVGNVVESWRTYDPDYYKDVPTTLVNVVEDLDRWMQGWHIKPSVSDPSCPSTTFDHRWTDAQYLTFRDRIHNLSPRLRAAYDTDGVAESVQAWQDIFGSSFPSTVSTAAALTASLTKSLPAVHPDRAPGERFIDEMFEVSLTHRVNVICDVSEPTYTNRADRRRALRSRNGRVPKRRSLLFRLVNTDVPEPFQVYWKVRNRGAEAASLRKLRGEITRDDGTRRHKETTLYTGHHYVECYVVKDGVCVAMWNEPVIID